MDEDQKQPQLTQLLRSAQAGDIAASTQFFEQVQGEMKRLAAHYMKGERRDHTLQPTALVNEAWLRIFGAGNQSFLDRTHFFAVASRAMRHVLVDHARGRMAEKRGAGAAKISLEDAPSLVHLEEHIGELDEALQALEKLEPQVGRVVELKFFGGLTDQEIADTIGINFAQVRRDWTFGKSWLHHRLTGPRS
jgi:RNA polymerase sigma-70 factor, ECF subfamily